jgi:hypothetical protein
MKIYWLKIRSEDRSGTEFGITAYNWDDAMSLLAKASRAISNVAIDATAVENYREIENVDELDQNHVLPNMGVVLRRGIWFPNLPEIQ